MERVFKQKRAAESFAKKARAKGYYAGIQEEPTNSQASTKRGRAQRRYVVRYDTGGTLLGNSARRNPTKAQKRPTKLQRLMASTKRGKAKRVAKALSAYLKQQNPGIKLAGAKVQKLKGGVIKITPIKANAAGSGRKDYRSLASAQKAMDRLRAKGIYDAGIVYDAATRMYRLLWKGSK